MSDRQYRRAAGPFQEPTRLDSLARRIDLAAEAQRLEAAGLDWEAKHVAAILGISESTVYDTVWLRLCSHLAGKRRRRWTPEEFRAARKLETARRDTSDSFRTRRRGSR